MSTDEVPGGLSPLVDRPTSGRTFTATRRVRLGDVSPTGRLRLDATARYLQDVANDDATPVLGADALGWVVRRTTISVRCFPRFNEALELTTWGSGIGSRWAERRTSITGADGGHVEAASLWIYVDVGTGRPKRLDDHFLATYGEAAGGRSVGARLVHRDPPPDEAIEAGPHWTVRRTDLDLFDHVNNAQYWAVAEEAWALDRAELPWCAEIEHRDGLVQGQEVSVETTGDRLWILGDGVVAATLLRDRRA
ncbi:acyl-[acyl-carrier-protein] thioesterase [Aquihabitans sp. McL0605]|uniref:acyl-[acyl-carrier-protein] thioesterase n=1 Tax=Aquihabitans sp. McL0605 TaxID=3415671 RepID=UPI003CEEFF58